MQEGVYFHTRVILLLKFFWVHLFLRKEKVRVLCFETSYFPLSFAISPTTP